MIYNYRMDEKEKKKRIEIDKQHAHFFLLLEGKP